MGATPEMKEIIEKRKQEIKIQIQEVDDLIEHIRKTKQEQTHIETQKWLDWGFQLTVKQLAIDSYTVWCSQEYYGKIIQIMDEYKCSRREAEDRAGLTKEYRDMEVSKLRAKRINSIISLCKSHNQF